MIDNAARARSASAFSLIELLVVVAIIAALLSILMPATQRAMATARTTACMAKLREMGRAARMYANENEQLLPIHINKLWKETWNVDTGPNKSFTHYLMPYMGETVRYDDINGDGVVNWKDNDPYANGRPYFKCPEEPVVRRSFWSGWAIDYGINIYGYSTADAQEQKLFLPGFTYTGWHGKFHPMLTLYRNTSAVYMIDADDTGPEDIAGAARGLGTGPGMWPLYWSFEKSAYMRHVGGWNAVQLDGAGVHYDGAQENFDKWYTYAAIPRR